jgi:hypothetical protein
VKLNHFRVIIHSGEHMVSNGISIALHWTPLNHHSLANKMEFLGFW